MAQEFSKDVIESAYKDVERYALSRTEAQENPKAVLLGGQPGSGKAGLAAEAHQEFRAQGGAVVIDADRMREENPRYKQLSREDPQNAADRTQKEAGEWATRLTMTAAESRRNLIVDGTMRSPENIQALATRLREAGYDVEARVMAVNPETSMTRARLRFEEQVAERGTGRFVNREQHDNAYSGMVESVRALERDKLADGVRLYDANQRMVYENRLERGEWQKTAEAAQVLERERGRDWTHAERRDYVSALQEINSLAQQRETGRAGSDARQIGDRPELAEKLERAKADLGQFEQGRTYQRAQAFDQLPKLEALARHPDLDGAYMQLHNVKQGWSQAPNHERDVSMANARNELSEQLHRGQVPRADVSVEESKRVIDLAANFRGLMVRDAGDTQRDARGEVVAESSHHVLVQVSDMVAIRYEKASLDRDVNVGEKVAIQYGNDKSQVYEQGKEPAREQDRGGPDVSREITR